MNAKVIAQLRRIVDLAEKGEIASIAIATVGPDLSTGSAFVLGDGTLSELLGSILLMQHRIMTNAESGKLE